MPSTHQCLNIHLVFGTRNREPMISADWMEKLHAYLGGTVRGLGGVALEIGGIADHVHILMGIKATHCLSDMVREIKSESSRWVHGLEGGKDFAWQEGYGAFTVSPSHCDAVRTYIQNQAEHHRVRTFRDEYLDFLKRAGVEFDERYVD
jgi:REP element-mobilizing transposase RayT